MSCNDHKSCNCVSTTAVQSFDDMDFERGIWNAAMYGDFNKTKRLISSINDTDKAGYSALHYAARNGHLDVCKLLIDNGADIDAITRSGGATALHRACTTGKEDVVKYLIERKADASIKDSDGKTVLHRAAENKHLSICEFLMSKFPDLKNVPDNHGRLPDC